MIPAGFQTEEQYSFPNIVNVCVLRGTCTANCVHCPVGLTPIPERKKCFGNQVMSLDLFKKIADETSKFKHSTLRIHSIGEPTLWKELENALSYAKDKGVITWIFTNAVIKDKHTLEILAKNCSIIEISVNSFDEKNYLATKGVNAFELVKQNIKYISDFIYKNNLKTRLIVSRVESEDKEYDKKFVEYWKNSGLVSDAFIRSYHSYNSLITDRDKSERKKIIACCVHWTRFNIDCDGKSVVCFNELFRGPSPDKSLVLGDVNNISIQNIWQGEKLAIIRKAQLEEDYSLINFTKTMPCLNCHYCQPLDTNRQTSEHQVKQLK
jgi:pyruvate-formate lyase-activating enzyme